MADIKTRAAPEKNIKTKKNSVKSLERTFRRGRNIKEAARAIRDAVNPEEKVPDNAPAELVERTERRGVFFAGEKSYQTVKFSAREAIHVKKRLEGAKGNIKMAKQSIKTAGQSIKSGKQAVDATIRASSTTIKSTARGMNAAGRVTYQTARTAAHITVQSTKIAAETTVHVTGAIARATAHAAVAAAQATVATAQAIGAFIAAGGWIIFVIIIVAALLAYLCSSALGIHFTDTQAFAAVQQDLSVEFREKLAEQETYLQSFDKIAVRPAPILTQGQWNDIYAVFAVRAQKDDLIAAELSKKEIELLRKTMWDMITFTPSSETVTTPGIDENGNAVAPQNDFGVITVSVKAPDDMTAFYGFTEDDRDMLGMVLSLFETDENTNKLIAGGSPDGKFINPCPDGTIIGNDYPTKNGSNVFHAGRDIMAPKYTMVYAAADGVVVHVNDLGEDYGQHIMIDHGGEVYSLYANCNMLLVSVGQQVKQGQKIALSGNTGNSIEPHLHFEIRSGGDKIPDNSVDPLLWIS